MELLAVVLEKVEPVAARTLEVVARVDVDLLVDARGTYGWLSMILSGGLNATC